MAKVTVDNLTTEINKILKDYEDEVSENLDVITKKIGQKGAQTLRNESKSSFGTNKKSPYKYAKGWSVKTDKGRLYTTATIHNKEAGLPHLLEHGHAVVAGGREAGHYSGKEHIKPVEQKLIESYEREVKAKL